MKILWPLLPVQELEDALAPIRSTLRIIIAFSGISFYLEISSLLQTSTNLIGT